MNHWRKAGPAVFAAVVLGVLTACGGSDADDSTPASSASTPAATAAAAEGDDDLIKGLTPQAFYEANCATCHGAAREGGVGLPLTPDALTESDDFYADVIKNGRPGTGMQMMGTILGMSDDDIETLVEFLKTDQP